jgi:uncharacterized protein YraI
MPAIIGIVIVIAIVIAYVKAMAGWFEYFFLDAFLLAAFIALTVAPIVYGYGAWRTFEIHAKGSRRAFLWLLIMALLFWIYLDLALLLDAAVTLMRASAAWPDWLRYQDSRLLNALQPFLSEYMRLMQVGIHTLLGVRVGAAQAATSGLYGLYGIVFKVTAIVALLLTLRGFKNDYQDHTEPAFRQYFFGAAWLDLRALLTASATSIGAYYDQVVKRVSVCFGGDVAVFTWIVLVVIWPLAIAVALAFFILPVLLGAVFLPLLFGIHALALAVFALLFISLAMALFGIERSILFLRSGWAKCPHPKCYRPVVLPVYRCQCGAEHKRLVPGRCGVFRRICSNCRRALPTLSWFGKQDLAAECSHAHCRLPLHHALFSGNLTLPLYGGAAAGKTMFRNAALVQLIQGRQPDLKAEFIDSNDGADYRMRIEPAFARGQVAPKTTALQPPAFLLSLRRRATSNADGLPVSLYLYDPDGAMTDSEVQRDQQRYLRHAGGLALLIDPLSLPSLKAAWERSGTPLPAGTCKSDPLSLVEGLLAALEDHTGVGADRRLRQRLAVILTKGDLPLVQETLGVSTAAPNTDETWDTLDSSTSACIRDWLRNHEPALLQRLERHFSRVEFFLVSAMGHDASVPKSFEPKRVLEPLLWLLSAHRALRRPLLTRVAMTAVEVTIVAVLVALFALVPLVGISIAGSLLDLARQPIASASKGRADDRHVTFAQPPTDPSFRQPSPPPWMPNSTPVPIPASIAIVQSGVATGLSDNNNPLPFREQFTVGEVPLVYYVQYRNAAIGTVITAHWLQGGTEVNEAPYSIAHRDGYAWWKSPALPPGRHTVRLTLNDRELAHTDFAVTSSRPAPGKEPIPGNGAEAVVTAIQLNVRNGPGTAYPVLFKLYQDQTVRILERRTLPDGDVWGRIIAAAGNGWVNTARLRMGLPTVTVSPSVGTAWVNTTQINVRNGPGPDYTSLKKLPRDTQLDVLEYRRVGPDAMWARISAGSLTGWVNAKLLRQ